ncbi:hypothetical protein KM043_012982 [Ampulex compressa]|nr:hypothetical protein KM043_012982 [Ampulex compressa]
MTSSTPLTFSPELPLLLASAAAGGGALAGALVLALPPYEHLSQALQGLGGIELVIGLEGGAGGSQLARPGRTPGTGGGEICVSASSGSPHLGLERCEARPCSEGWSVGAEARARGGGGISSWRGVPNKRTATFLPSKDAKEKPRVAAASGQLNQDIRSPERQGNKAIVELHKIHLKIESKVHHEGTTDPFKIQTGLRDGTTQTHYHLHTSERRRRIGHPREFPRDPFQRPKSHTMTRKRNEKRTSEKKTRSTKKTRKMIRQLHTDSQTRMKIRGDTERHPRKSSPAGEDPSEVPRPRIDPSFPLFIYLPWKSFHAGGGHERTPRSGCKAEGQRRKAPREGGRSDSGGPGWSSLRGSSRSRIDSPAAGVGAARASGMTSSPRREGAASLSRIPREGFTVLSIAARRNVSTDTEHGHQRPGAFSRFPFETPRDNRASLLSDRREARIHRDTEPEVGRPLSWC